MTEEQRELVIQNHNLIYSFLNKYGLPISEFYDLAAIGLCRAAVRYDQCISSFSTYAYRCMLSECSHEHITKNRKKRIPEELIRSLNLDTEMSDGTTLPFEEIVASEVNVEEEVLFEVMVHEIKQKLKPKHKYIFEQLIIGKDVREIAKEMGCSHQNIFTHKKVIEKECMQYLQSIY